ncbi:hypothetical protein ZYGR_0AG05940 [Zygosaccharomyces rouxii]|uniref:Damage-regulated import facilitator 1 n=1 Tax=Zygosaccharomyces rouxii TaxID=4956 RepID=A0A1Q3AAI8_ZYGRO|nr:hypothetical protein ZYGR_0AG05940 [Zygosaccharomyces rouxii]
MNPYTDKSRNLSSPHIRIRYLNLLDPHDRQKVFFIALRISVRTLYIIHAHIHIFIHKMLSQPNKKQLQIRIEPQEEKYDYQNQLGTIGMRIRQSVDQGYRLPNKFVQDNSSVTIPDYKRVPMSKNPPMLVNQRTVSSTSSIEAWENDLDQRLTTIDDQSLTDKLGMKRNWDQADF